MFSFLQIIDSMELDNRNGSSKNLKHVDSSVKTRFPSTCSIENSQELFVIDVDVLNQIRKANQDRAPALQASPVSSSKVAGQSPSSHSGYSSSSATHSSETLVTAPPRGYDPNRIPASVFANKPANPGDWSVASNESLFSLHMGNSSFSRETFLTLYKSGELGKLEDPIKSVKPDESITISKPDEQNHFQPSLPPVTEGENMDKVSGEDMERGSNVASDTPKAAAIVETAESHYQEKPPPAPENDRLVCPSEGSGNSNKSFVFQV